MKILVKKKNITPEKAKVISTLLVSLVFMTIVLSLSSMYTSKLLKDAEQEYFDSVHTTLNSYSKIISLQLDDYIHTMQVFYMDRTFENPDLETHFLAPSTVAISKRYS